MHPVDEYWSSTAKTPRLVKNATETGCSEAIFATYLQYQTVQHLRDACQDHLAIFLAHTPIYDNSPRLLATPLEFPRFIMFLLW